MPPVKSLSQWLGPWTRLVYSLAALAGVIAVGAVGFCLVEGWSLGDSLRRDGEMIFNP